MSKTISFTYDKKDYTLEFNRNAIKWLESKGMGVNDLETKLVTGQEMLFRASFRMHHIDTKDEVILNIFDAIDNKSGLFEKLVEMYSDTLNSLVNGSGNIQWGASW